MLARLVCCFCVPCETRRVQVMMLARLVCWFCVPCETRRVQVMMLARLVRWGGVPDVTLNSVLGETCRFDEFDVFWPCEREQHRVFRELLGYSQNSCDTASSPKGGRVN